MSAQPHLRRGFGGGPMPGMTLQYPMSLGVYGKYAEAQRAVDYLSDHEFPVQDCMIVGTDLRQVERVTGRLTRGRVALGGILSGVWLGLFVGLIFALFDTGNNKVSWIGTVIATVVFGAIFGLVWALIGYAATQGRRDFTSVSQVVATKYEVLVEHRHAQRARELLTQLDPMRAAQAEADARVRAAQEEARRRAQQQGQAPPDSGA